MRRASGSPMIGAAKERRYSAEVLGFIIRKSWTILRRITPSPVRRAFSTTRRRRARFPASVAAAPLPRFPQGAVAPLRNLYIRAGASAYLDQFFPTATLTGYPGALPNPYSEQWTFGVERRLARQWVLTADYIGSHTLRIDRPLDVNPPAPFIRTAPGQIRSAQAANCTRPYWIWWYAQQKMTCNPAVATNPQPPYSVIQSDVSDGYSYYEALDVNLSHRFSGRLSMLASYVWSHAIDNVDPDVPRQSPNNPNVTGLVENGNAIFDERHRFVLSMIYVAPLRIHIGGITTLGSGFPFNIVTGITNSGDLGATTDRPVIDGVVVGRNTGRGMPIYDVRRLWSDPSPWDRSTGNCRSARKHLTYSTMQISWGTAEPMATTPHPAQGSGSHWRELPINFRHERCSLRLSLRFDRQTLAAPVE